MDDENERNWYVTEASKETWSVSRKLQRNISSQYYHRMVSTLVKDQVHNEILKFLGLSKNNTYLESDMEKAIISHLQKFYI